MDPFTGEIRLLPYNFVPLDFLPCNGQTLLIQQYQALYSVIGTRFGGNGTTQFMLPNLNGRVAMGSGNGTGVPNAQVGNTFGSDAVTLTQVNYPPHNHLMSARDGTEATFATDTPSANAYLAQPRSINLYQTTGTTNTLAEGAVQPAGTGNGTASRSVMQPFLALGYCICTNGEYPVKP